MIEAGALVLDSNSVIGLGVVAFASAVLNAWQAYKSRTATTATSALDVTNKELEIYKQRADRLQSENTEQKGRIVKLESATDLQTLSTNLATMAAENTKMHAATLHGIETSTSVISEIGRQAAEVARRSAEESALLRKTLLDVGEIIQRSR